MSFAAQSENFRLRIMLCGKIKAFAGGLSGQPIEIGPLGISAALFLLMAPTDKAAGGFILTHILQLFQQAPRKKPVDAPLPLFANKAVGFVSAFARTIN